MDLAKIKLAVCCTVVLACSTHSALAATGTFFDKLDLSFAAGPAWTHTSNSHIIVSSAETDNVPINHSTNAALWKVGIGTELFNDQAQPCHYCNHLRAELNLYHSKTKMKGYSEQYQDPIFTNYKFNIPVTSTRLMLDLKPSLFHYQGVSSYLIAGAGYAWNTVSYRETSLSAAATDPLMLSSKQSGNFSYDLGLGVQAAINQQLSASLEYLYTSLGKLSTSTQSDLYSNSSIARAPRFNNAATQAILLGVTWKIN